MPRRRVLQAAGIGGAAMVAAACGARPPAHREQRQPPRRSRPGPSPTSRPPTQKLNWSTWVGYIDVDDDGNRPTLDRFMEQTGIEVDYREDVNDNAEFDAKVRPQLEAGQDIGRDIVVLTDWMAAQWIRKGYAQKFDRAWVPNARNLIDKLANVPFDPERDQSLPWQSGLRRARASTPRLLKELTGKSEIRTIAELWDPALKGRVTILSEMRDSVGVVMLAQGNDPADFTEDDFNAAIAELQKQMDAGQIRQVSGNDYIAALETGDVVAAIGWSGDVAALGDPVQVRDPGVRRDAVDRQHAGPGDGPAPEQRRAPHGLLLRPGRLGRARRLRAVHLPGQGRPGGDGEDRPEPGREPVHLPDGGRPGERVTVFKTLTSSEQVKYDQAFQTLIGN